MTIPLSVIVVALIGVAFIMFFTSKPANFYDKAYLEAAKTAENRVEAERVKAERVKDEQVMAGQVEAEQVEAARMEAVLRAELAAEKKAREEAEARAKMVGTAGPVLATPAPINPLPRTLPATTGTKLAFSASGSLAGSRAGEVRKFAGIEMVWCPPGEFFMGSPLSEVYRRDNETQHPVSLTKGFWLAKTETTQGQWQGVMGDNPSKVKGNELPVVQVSWDDVQGWVMKMNSPNVLASGWKWVLPSEAQWEYACRAGTTTMVAGDLDEMAWYEENSGNKAHPVGMKKANEWGLHDMHGNVLEWCADWIGDYESGFAIDPTGAISGDYRVYRGGSWSDDAQRCRSASRDDRTPGLRGDFLGFRPALVPSK